MKINKTAYYRIMAQAEAAKELGNDELHDLVSNTDVKPSDDITERPSRAEALFKVKSLLWNAVMEIVSYHDAERVGLEDLESVIEETADDFFSAIEETLGITKEGPGEEKVPGGK